MIRKFSVIGLFFAFSLFVIVGCEAQQGNNNNSNTTKSLNNDNNSDMNKISYGYGVLLGQSLKQQGMDALDLDRLKEGIRDVIQGNNLEVDEDEALRLVQEYDRDMRVKKSQEAVAVENVFFDENAKKDGVVTTNSGLQYKVLREGTGKSPNATDVVNVDYEGTLLDGTVFDSSYDRGEPIEFPLDRVIAGWTEGLQLMKEGAKYEFFIPSRLGYGEQAAGSIPPNSILKFVVELHQVK